MVGASEGLDGERTGVTEKRSCVFLMDEAYKTMDELKKKVVT